MSQRGRGRGREADKACMLKALKLLNSDIGKYCTSQPQELQRRDAKKNTQGQNMTPTITQRQTSSLPQFPVSSSLHAPSSSFLPAQSSEHMPPPSATLQHKQTSLRSLSPATKSFTQNIHSSSKLQNKQTSSRSPSLATKSFTQNIHALSKPQHKEISRSLPSLVQRNRLSQAKGHEEEWTEDEGTSREIVL